MLLFDVFYCCFCFGEVARSEISTNHEKCLVLLVLLMHLKAFSVRGKELHFNVVVQKIKTG